MPHRPVVECSSPQDGHCTYAFPCIRRSFSICALPCTDRPNALPCGCACDDGGAHDRAQSWWKVLQPRPQAGKQKEWQESCSLMRRLAADAVEPKAVKVGKLNGNTQRALYQIMRIACLAHRVSARPHSSLFCLSAVSQQSIPEKNKALCQNGCQGIGLST